MKIEEGDKLITLFMGELWGNRSYYHESWDALMPVVAKIYGIDMRYDPFYDVSLSSSITQIWEAVVEFIQWYNENK